jgi:DNA-binding MarR family transcriptional regulator
MPSVLARELKLSRPNVSITLSELASKNLVECVNPKDKRGRLYKITKFGKQILKEINQ